MKLTEPQYLALKKYEDEQAHNETALRIHETVYNGLTKKKLVQRSAFLMSRITPEGRAALAAHEERLAKRKVKP